MDSFLPLTIGILLFLTINLDLAIARLNSESCEDSHEMCDYWKSRNLCTRENPIILYLCPTSCNRCYIVLGNLTEALELNKPNNYKYNAKSHVITFAKDKFKNKKHTINKIMKDLLKVDVSDNNIGLELDRQKREENSRTRSRRIARSKRHDLENDKNYSKNMLGYRKEYSGKVLIDQSFEENRAFSGSMGKVETPFLPLLGESMGLFIEPAPRSYETVDFGPKSRLDQERGLVIPLIPRKNPGGRREFDPRPRGFDVIPITPSPPRVGAIRELIDPRPNDFQMLSDLPRLSVSPGTTLIDPITAEFIEVPPQSRAIFEPSPRSRPPSPHRGLSLVSPPISGNNDFIDVQQNSIISNEIPFGIPSQATPFRLGRRGFDFDRKAKPTKHSNQGDYTTKMKSVASANQPASNYAGLQRAAHSQNIIGYSGATPSPIIQTLSSRPNSFDPESQAQFQSIGPSKPKNIVYGALTSRQGYRSPMPHQMMASHSQYMNQQMLPSLSGNSGSRGQTSGYSNRIGRVNAMGYGNMSPMSYIQSIKMVPGKDKASHSKLHAPQVLPNCVDTHHKCNYFATNGMCSKYFVMQACPNSCDKCEKSVYELPKHDQARDPTAAQLNKQASSAAKIFGPPTLSSSSLGGSLPPGYLPPLPDCPGPDCMYKNVGSQSDSQGYSTLSVHSSPTSSKSSTSMSRTLFHRVIHQA